VDVKEYRRESAENKKRKRRYGWRGGANRGPRGARKKIISKKESVNRGGNDVKFLKENFEYKTDKPHKTPTDRKVQTVQRGES